MSTLHENLTQRTKSPFTDEEMQCIKTFNAFMGLYEDEVNGVMQELLKEHAILGPLVKQIPESIQEMNRKRSV